MQPTDVKRVRQAIEAAKKFAHATTLDGCDVADLDEVFESTEQELKRPLPNPHTLATYMNSLIRSLRPQHHAPQIIAQLHEVMSLAGIQIESET